MARPGMTPVPLSPQLATGTLPESFSQPLAPAERPSRSALVAVADSYFNAIEQGTGHIKPFDVSCNRRENGTQTTNVSMQLPDGTTTPRMTCEEQFENGTPWAAPERRPFIVDNERGVVVGMYLLQDANDRPASDLMRGGPPPFIGRKPLFRSVQDQAQAHFRHRGRSWPRDPLWAAQRLVDAKRGLHRSLVERASTTGWSCWRVVAVLRDIRALAKPGLLDLCFQPRHRVLARASAVG